MDYIDFDHPQRTYEVTSTRLRATAANPGIAGGGTYVVSYNYNPSILSPFPSPFSCFFHSASLGPCLTLKST